MSTPAGPDVLPPVIPALPMPAPIASADELAEQIALLDHRSWRTVAVERLLEATVRLNTTDPDGLHAALPPVLDRAEWANVSWWGSDRTLQCNILLSAALRRAAGQPAKLEETYRTLRRHQPISTPQHVLGLRLAEIGAAVAERSVPALVATPTWCDGRLHPEALLERLTRADREGWTPLPHDLTQALYRLSIPDADAATLKAARALPSPAAARLTEWLQSGGLPTPPVALTQIRPKALRDTNWLVHALPAWRFYATTAAIPNPASDPFNLASTKPPSHLNGAETPWAHPLLWPAVLPNHRDLAAAHCLPLIAQATDTDTGAGLPDLLGTLTELSGPTGPALTAVLAYALAANRPEERIAAQDALLTLAAQDLSPTLLGTVLATMAADRVIVLSRTLPQLADLAATAPLLTWTIAAAALTYLLPREEAALTSRTAAADTIGTAPTAAADTTGTVPTAAADTAGTIPAGAADTTGTVPTGAADTAGPVTADTVDSADAANPVSLDVSGSPGQSTTADRNRQANSEEAPRKHSTPHGLPDLLTLATTSALASGSTCFIPTLAELAARKGSSRLLTEARRLHKALTDPAAA